MEYFPDAETPLPPGDGPTNSSPSNSGPEKHRVPTASDAYAKLIQNIKSTCEAEVPISHRYFNVATGTVIGTIIGGGIGTVAGFTAGGIYNNLILTKCHNGKLAEALKRSL